MSGVGFALPPGGQGGSVVRAAAASMVIRAAALALLLVLSACRGTPAPAAPPAATTPPEATGPATTTPEATGPAATTSAGTTADVPAADSTSTSRQAAAVAPAAGESRVTTVAPSSDRPAAARARRPAMPVDRGSRRDLSIDEGRGGHTLERHVGKTDDELRARLSRERQISASSTYTDLAAAEATVAAALAEQSRRVSAWTDRRGPRPNLALDYHGPPGTTIGRTIRRGQRSSDPCTDAVVVLRWDTRRDDYYVLTSYPERRR